MRPIVLTIAGSDSCGGAGIQADLKAIEACGGYAATALTAVTAQNTRGVIRADALAASLVQAQIEAVFADLDVAAVKSGMLAGEAIVRQVATALAAHRPRHYVLDPVMLAKSGHALLDRASIASLIEMLVPLAELVTPNVHEARVLSGLEVEDATQAERAGRRLLERGARAVLVKGGHLSRDRGTDVLVTPRESRLFRADFIETPHTHGTGCTYAAAIATHLARGLPLGDAIASAKAFVTRAIQNGLPIGRGQGPPDPFFFLHEASAGVPNAAPLGRLHVLTDETVQTRYTHVELARMAFAGGADVVQLREKRLRPAAEQVRVACEVLEIARARGRRLLIDDRVDVAAAIGADGVHLGGADLDASVARRLLGAAACIGQTVNGFGDLAAARGAPVDYLGVGPVFGTSSKANPAPAMGLGELARIVRSTDRPVIAIGGIVAERVPEVLATGAYGIAVLSAVACDRDPAVATARLREAIDSQEAVRNDEIVRQRS